jgi:hypothetical protein
LGTPAIPQEVQARLRALMVKAGEQDISQPLRQLLSTDPMGVPFGVHPMLGNPCGSFDELLAIPSGKHTKSY